MGVDALAPNVAIESAFMLIDFVRYLAAVWI